MGSGHPQICCFYSLLVFLVPEAFVSDSLRQPVIMDNLFCIFSFFASNLIVLKYKFCDLYLVLALCDRKGVLINRSIIVF